MAVSNFQIFCAVTVVAVATFINLPAPRFSQRLQEWKNMGQYFNYRGNAIFYQDFRGYKQDEESVVLCIHGFPTSNYDWSKVWEPLKRNFGRVIAADMLGLGFSDKPRGRDYTVMEQATLQEEFVRYLGIHKVHILAHDLGDTVALEMLARYEERKAKMQDTAENELQIESLCLTNGGIFPETNFPMVIQKLSANSWIGPLLVRLASYPLFARSLASVFGPQTRPSREELQDFWTIARHKDGYLVAPSILQYMSQRRENRGRWVGVMQTTSVPVHLIYGPADPINPPITLAKYRELVVKGTFTSLKDDIGHYPHWEDPDGFMAAYQHFLSKFMQEK
ncbi:mesoderm-specific transcript protein-like [Porites lutea]|uniref:mesoderm-specific transcript protein-like n=1 Tax=Porites lutea TaxID=51062 RepID=UPI003CC52A05